MREAIFVAIEGADCCGKGTQVKYLAERLEAKTFKFPDKNTPIGALIYDHLFKKWNVADRQQWREIQGDLKKVDAMVFQCMQMANRLEHAQEIVETLHTLKQNVVSDRYTASGVVYGGHDGLDQEYVHEIQDYLPKPDLNILLDINVDEVIERMKNRGDTPDRYETPEITGNIITRYLQYWDSTSDLEEHKWAVINANQPPIEVAAEVVAALKSFRVTERLKEPVQW
jgi:dTMP kinase